MNDEAYKKEKVFSTSQLNKKYNTKVSNLFFLIGVNFFESLLATAVMAW